MSLAEAEKKPTLSILEPTDGNRTLALEVLGISREGLRTKVAGSPFARMVGRDFAHVNAFVITLVIPGWTTTKKSPCRNCFLADSGAESDSLRV